MTLPIPPLDPIEAVTCEDPYPYYAQLIRGSGFSWEPNRGMWIATSASAVRETLNSELCAVRPEGEPVPPAIDGTPSGDLFRRLVRMNDGRGHRTAKQAVVQALMTLDEANLEADSRKVSRRLLANPAGAPPFALALPAIVLASALGLPDRSRLHVARRVNDFVRCLSPLSTPAELKQANTAARHLTITFTDLLSTFRSGHGNTLLKSLRDFMRQHGMTGDDLVVANAIGFLSQACEASAGLIGNALVLLSKRPDLMSAIEHGTVDVQAVVREVLRFDAPIQNTRRFIVQDGELCGHRVRSGESILVVLAAANRDPSHFDLADTFDLTRNGAEHFGFGSGVHQCPGSTPAVIIAAAGLDALRKDGAVDRVPVGGVVYFNSANARIPRIPGVTVIAEAPAETFKMGEDSAP